MHLKLTRSEFVLALVLLALTAPTQQARAQQVPAQQTPAQPAPANPHLSEALQPHPSLSPRQVVEIQLEALRHNDDDDTGIEVVFRFASPANRMQTGPLDRFKRMIHGGPYALMLNFESVVYDEPEVARDMARQRVVLVSREQTLGYYFILSRQMEPPYKDCWMTEMVGVVPIGGTMARRDGTALDVASLP